MDARVIRTSCRGCHGSCGVLVHLGENGQVARITGDKNSPISKGFICSKGRYAAELLYHPDRLLRPRLRTGKRGEGKWKDIPWDEAIDLMVKQFDRIRNEAGPEYISISQGTGRPHTEFTGRFSHALGSPNTVGPTHICYVPRLICSSITLGWFPQADIYGRGGEMPRCVLLLGTNVMSNGSADGFCGNMVDRAFKQAQTTIVVDPRATYSAQAADMHLALRPGSECALILAMLHVVIRDKVYDADFVEKHCTGFDKLAEHVRPLSPAWAEPITRVPAELIERAARAFATTKPATMLWGNGVDESICAFQTARAVYLLLAICGTLDVPGGMVRWVPPTEIRPKSPLINPEHAGVQFISPEQQAKKIGSQFPFCPGTHPPSFWQACVSGKPYKPKAIWMMGTNPILTQTRGDLIREALRDHLEFVVTSDFVMTPTAEHSDLVLPTLHWLEQDDVVFLMKLWCALARQRVTHVGETRDDREVIIDVARRLGLTEAFPWENWQAYLKWVLEPSGMSFDEFTKKGFVLGDMRYRKHESEGFPTPSGKVELFSSIMDGMGVEPLPVYVESPLSHVSRPDLAEKYPFMLLAGCKKTPFFQSEGRVQPSLRRLHPNPVTEMHPDAARKLGLENGQKVVVSTPYGAQEYSLLFDDRLPIDVVNAEYGWWFPEQPGPDHGCFTSNSNMLFSHDYFDPLCGAELLKSSLCRVDAKV